MFNKTNQVQTIDVNEWVNKLLAARDDIKAVEKIRKELDRKFSKYISDRESDLDNQRNLYDWYYNAVIPSLDDFADFIAQTIDYQLPDDLVDRWQLLIVRYQQIKQIKEEKN